MRIGWNKFTQLVPLLTNKDLSLIVRGRLYSSCAWCVARHGDGASLGLREGRWGGAVADEDGGGQMICDTGVRDGGGELTESGVGWYGLGAAAGQVAVVWACCGRRTMIG